VAKSSEFYEKLKQEEKQILAKLDQLAADALSISERRDGSPFGKREEEADSALEMERRIAQEERARASLASKSAPYKNMKQALMGYVTPVVNL